MHSTDHLILCASCRKLSLETGKKQPHAYMGLQHIRPPSLYEGTLERQYRCAQCHATWLRRTNSCGVDKEFRLLP
jgi:hypothetical protein